VPVWHEATKRWVREGKLAVLGITQEQHPERCRLFAQWKQFDWPILHDPIDVTGPRVVPIVMAIDEYGIIRSTRPRIDTFEEEFLNKTFPAPPDAAKAAQPAVARAPDLAALQERAKRSDTAADWRACGDALVLWGGIERNDDAIAAYRRAAELAPSDGDAHFRLGVCYRRRFESENRGRGDFQSAIDAWGRALAIDPNHYIWRRRIQQYGPRLIKPYPFYDWIELAIRDIRERGETPIELAVRPSGAEIASPQRRFAVSETDAAPPDPQGRINRDTAGLIDVEVAIVPSRIKPGESVRAHVTLRPNRARQAHWNNENEPLKLWVEAPHGWKTDRPLRAAPQGGEPETTETRSIEFELQSPQDASGTVKLSAYALYYVCEGANGTCLYLRHDIPIEVRFEE
jgi:hypothetical protein